jgi:DNA transposition AAA+ family ATPase
MSKKVVETIPASVVAESRSLMAPGPVPLSCFVESKEYGRFVQVCEASRRYGYMVVCVGESGVGKTWAARKFAQWDLIEPLLSPHGVTFSSTCPIPRTALYTPKPTATPKGVEHDVAMLRWSLQMLADHARTLAIEERSEPVFIRPDVINMLIVDEVESLSPPCIEVLRHVFEKDHVSVVFLSRPGSERRLLNMPAVASRVGVLHGFGTLGKADTRKLLEQELQKLRVSVEENAIELFIEKTRGNFQKMRLVLDHIDYMIGRHGAFAVTVEVIEEAVARLLNERNVHLLRGRR